MTVLFGSRGSLSLPLRAGFRPSLAHLAPVAPSLTLSVLDLCLEGLQVYLEHKGSTPAVLGGGGVAGGRVWAIERGTHVAIGVGAYERGRPVVLGVWWGLMSEVPL